LHHEVRDNKPYPGAWAGPGREHIINYSGTKGLAIVAKRLVPALTHNHVSSLISTTNLDGCLSRSSKTRAFCSRQSVQHTKISKDWIPFPRTVLARVLDLRMKAPDPSPIAHLSPYLTRHQVFHKNVMN
jgi:hypothetical protein